MLKNFLLLAVLSAPTLSCTDAQWDKQFGSLNSPHEVLCVENGVVLFHGVSTGRVQDNSNSDGSSARFVVYEVHPKMKHIRPETITTVDFPTSRCIVAKLKDWKRGSK